MYEFFVFAYDDAYIAFRIFKCVCVCNHASLRMFSFSKDDNCKILSTKWNINKEKFIVNYKLLI